ncbi:MAG TPA: monovalent cation/H+ antiporter complex subunit F [Mycobacteriales bacterium]|nr:monovalent cation/H+ antiporter complex subunit F [Mycobacteriales bacterium]
MTTVALVCYAGLALAAAACLLRLVLGPTVPDRIVALDTLLYVVVLGIAVAAATSGDGSFLGVLVAAALLAFVGTTTVARFVERRGGE